LPYLDYNATNPLRMEAKNAMLQALDEVGNASSIHTAGRQARSRVEAARAAIAAAVQVAPAQVVFTSGATEANALALAGVPHASLIIGATEHDSVWQNALTAPQVPVDENGLIRLNILAQMLQAAPRPTLVSIMWANNETGVIQPVDEIVRIVHEAGALLHVDAVQALGRVPVRLGEIDMLSLSAHKVGGPQGVGALVLRDGLIVTPIVKGGGQEKGQRPGTENVAAIAGFGAAVAVAATCQQVPQWQEWRDKAAQRLLQLQPEAQIVGLAAPRLANTLCLVHPRLSAEIQLMKLDLAGFAVSAGSACSSGRVKESRVLAAMGMAEKSQKSSIRVSFGWNTAESELQDFVTFWTQM